MKRCEERHRADKFPEPDSESEFGRPSRARAPSPAIACSAHFRSRYLTPEAIDVLKSMDSDTAKEVCVNVLKALGYVVSLRLASTKRDRSKEIAKRSAKRAEIRAAKAEEAKLKVLSQ